MFLSIVRLIEMLGTLVHVGRHTDRFRIIAYVIFGMLDFFGYRRPQRLFQSVVIDFLQPVTDHDAGNTVADHVGDGARLRHEAVDAENQSKTGTGTWPTAESVAASTINPEPVTPAAPLLVSNSTARSVSCCTSVICTSQACAIKTAAIVR